MDLLGLLLCQAKLIVMRKLVPAAAKRILSSLMPEHVAWQQHVTRKKLPNIHKSCPKMIPLQIWYILTTLQKLPKNMGDLGKLIVAKGLKKLAKVQKIAQSGHTGQQFFLTWTIPSLFFIYFRSLQTKNTIFTTNQCEKMSNPWRAGIQTHDHSNMSRLP